ncbi:MAG: hypothetical protein NTZ25_04665 [Candidatus Peregrinibacteria bacterium]|nr:hypothetical protein [Candidatus Peregrinibacteria bacterium]
MSEKIPQRAEVNDVKASDFDKKLNELKFDEKALKTEMYEILANSQGYSLIRGEINDVSDASNKKFGQAHLDSYVIEQGGTDFLKQVYEKGVAGLKKDFENQKQKLKKNISVIQSDKKDFRTQSFKESRLAAKIIEVAAASNVEVEDLTFEQAFNHNLFSDSLKPTIKGVAEYGLTWFEYKNRNARKAALKRKEQSRDVSEETTDRKLEKVDYNVKVEPKGPEVMVKLPKPRKVEKKDEERESLDHKMKSAKEQLSDIGKVYLQDLVEKNYSKYNFKVELINNGSSLIVLDGEKRVSGINLVRDTFKPIFTCNMRNFDLMDGSLMESVAQIKRYVKNRELEAVIKKDEQQAREKIDGKEWFSKAEEFVLSVNGIDDVKVDKDSHGFTRLFGKDVIKTNVVITVDKHTFYGELNIEKRSLVLRTPLVLTSKETGNSGVNSVHEFDAITLGDLTDKKKLVEDLKKMPEKYHAAEQKIIQTMKTQPLSQSI